MGVFRVTLRFLILCEVRLFSDGIMRNCRWVYFVLREENIILGGCISYYTKIEVWVGVFRITKSKRRVTRNTEFAPQKPHSSIGDS